MLEIHPVVAPHLYTSNHNPDPIIRYPRQYFTERKRTHRLVGKIEE